MSEKVRVRQPLLTGLAQRLEKPCRSSERVLDRGPCFVCYRAPILLRNLSASDECGRGMKDAAEPPFSLSSAHHTTVLFTTVALTASVGAPLVLIPAKEGSFKAPNSRSPPV